jgi:MFS family permease
MQRHLFLDVIHRRKTVLSFLGENPTPPEPISVELSPDQPAVPTPLDSGIDAGGTAAHGKRWLLSRDFALIWWSQVLSQVADGVSRLALLWFVYTVTGSAMKTSVIGLLQTLSPIVLGPLIGVTVDRLPKKVILIVTDVARGILIGLIPCVLSIEVFTVDMLYVLVFLYGIATAMFVPTLSSSVPFLVDRPRFVAANAMLQSTTSLGIVIGPLLSGVGIAFAGSQEVLCANALIYFASALCLIPIRLPWSRLSHQSSSAVAATFHDLIEGLRYTLISQRTIVVLIALASIYTFGAGAYTTLFPVFGKKMLALGPVEVGYLWSWLGIGLFVVSLALVSLTQWDVRRRILVVSVSSIIGGAALCGLVWTESLTVATVLVTIIGMGLGTWTPIAWGMIQEFVPAQMVGRVMAIYTAVATGTSLAGISFFGWLTEEANEYTSVMGIGLVFVMLGVAAAMFGRTLKPSASLSHVG